MTCQRIVIVGGGISGLAAAHRLCELGRGQGRELEITLLEAKDRFGGVISTEVKDGFLLEGGPDCFLSEKPWALDLCRRLGLEEEVIETRRNFRQSFIYRKGKLVPVPQGFYLTVPSRMTAFLESDLFTWRGKLRMACEFFIPPRRHNGDESIAGFVRRRFGREALERAAQPMIAGIYTGDPEKLSLQATMPRFREMEHRYGSLIRAYRKSTQAVRENIESASGPRYGLFLSLKAGMGSLVQTLIRGMPGVSLRTSASVAQISRAQNWIISLKDGSVLEADRLCLALPAPNAARLLNDVDPEIARALAGISYESVAAVHCVFRKQDIPELKGFGFVVPARENRKIVGCTFSAVKFAGRCPDDFFLIRAFVGGALHPGLFELDDERMKRLVIEELRALLGILSDPVLVSIARHPESMPQYYVGHLERVRQIEHRAGQFPGLYLTGNAFRGIGIPDCIHAAERTAEKILHGLG